MINKSRPSVTNSQRISSNFRPQGRKIRYAITSAQVLNFLLSWNFCVDLAEKNIFVLSVNVVCEFLCMDAAAHDVVVRFNMQLLPLKYGITFTLKINKLPLYVCFTFCYLAYFILLVTQQLYNYKCPSICPYVNFV